MEKIIIENAIPVFCVTAASFPAGIEAAFAQLKEKAALSGGRRHFGISRPEPGKGIVYKAAAEEMAAGEAEKFSCERLLIPQGTYHCITVTDFRNNLSAIGSAFDLLIKTTGIDPEGACVEWYFNDSDVRCMVRLES